MKRDGRPYFEAQWRDPVTGRLRTESTGFERRRDAERRAGQIEREVNAGTYRREKLTLWAAVADRYEAEVMTARAEKTGHKWLATRRAVEARIGPKALGAVDGSAISEMQSTMRRDGLSEATIKSHMATLRAFLRWSTNMGFLPAAPHIEMPKRTAKMKGRPITAEEFERMLGSVAAVVGERDAPGWKTLLKGLWVSGLRLGEALRLTWHEGPLAVSMVTDKPRLIIQPLQDKSTKARLLPLAPEFWEFLRAIDPAHRRGNVFTVGKGRNPDIRRIDVVSKTICEIGKKACVKVLEDGDRIKWASAHDLRRAFGQRWAARLLPQQLQELMRHESIHTTMTFYAGRNADAVEAAVEAFSTDSTNTSTNTASTGRKRPAQNKPQRQGR